MKVRVVVIDDEQRARQTLLSFLERLNYPIEIVGEGWDVQTSIQVIKEAQPHLIFLDIQLKDGTGFEILEQIQDMETHVVLITAYDHYAIRAFQMYAFGYLLKPLAISELDQLMSRFIEIHQLKNRQLASQTKILVEHLKSGQVKKLVLQNVNGFKVVGIDQIIYLKGEVNYTRFFLTGGEVIITSRTLKEYASLLEELGFFRIHQSYIINLTFVTEYIKGEGGIAVMSNGDQLTVSRRRKKAFVKQFIG